VKCKHSCNIRMSYLQVRSAQKLCRSVDFAKLYREQTCALAALSRSPPSLHMSGSSVASQQNMFPTSDINLPITSVTPSGLPSTSMARPTVTSGISSDQPAQGHTQSSDLFSELRGTSQMQRMRMPRRSLTQPTAAGLSSMSDLNRQLAVIQASLQGQ
jgi:hypothetical protein